MIVYRQFLLQVETGFLDDGYVEERIQNLISRVWFSRLFLVSLNKQKIENHSKTVARVFKSVSAVIDQEILAFRPYDAPQNDCDLGWFRKLVV